MNRGSEVFVKTLFFFFFFWGGGGGGGSGRGGGLQGGYEQSFCEN